MAITVSTRKIPYIKDTNRFEAYKENLGWRRWPEHPNGNGGFILKSHKTGREVPVYMYDEIKDHKGKIIAKRYMPDNPLFLKDLTFKVVIFSW